MKPDAEDTGSEEAFEAVHEANLPFCHLSDHFKLAFKEKGSNSVSDCQLCTGKAFPRTLTRAYLEQEAFGFSGERVLSSIQVFYKKNTYTKVFFLIPLHIPPGGYMLSA